MPQFRTVSRPYAHAIFSDAAKNQQLVEWLSVLEIAAAIEKHPLVDQLIGDPAYLDTELCDIFLSLCKAVDKSSVEALGENLSNLLVLLVERKRLAALPDIASIYHDLLADHQQVMEIEFTSAFTLDDSLRKSVQQRLEERFETQLSIQFSEDKSLIGGAIIRTQKEVMDGSIKGKLERLYNSLNS